MPATVTLEEELRDLVTHEEELRWEPKRSHGIKSELRLIPVGQLTVDPDYQRLFTAETKYREIVGNFNKVSLHVLAVAEREDGTLVLMDGQRRTQAAIEKHSARFQVPCWVTSGMTYAEEAAVFVDLNHNRLNVAKTQLFLSSLLAGRPLETEIDRIAQANDVKLGLGSWRAIGCVKDVFSMGVLDETFRVIHTAWGTAQKDVPPGMVFKGVGRFIQRYQSHPRFNLDRLALVLMGCRPDELAAKGRGRSAQMGARGGHIADGVASVITELFNGPQGRRIPKWS